MKSLTVRAVETVMRIAWEGFEVHLWATGAYDAGILTVDDPALRLKREPGDSKTRILRSGYHPVRHPQDPPRGQPALRRVARRRASLARDCRGGEVVGEHFRS
jgi:hypothetical protein